VRSAERAHELLDIADRNGWIAIIGVEPDKPEDSSDLENLMRRGNTTTVSAPKAARNNPCPCGSGRKFKNCCGRR
jgi:SWIM/SEC-C metal-binding protein